MADSDRCKIVLSMLIFLSLLLQACTITYIYFAKDTTTKQNWDELVPSIFRYKKENKNRVKRDTNKDPLSESKWSIFYLKKRENEQDLILKWFSKGKDTDNIASVNPDGRIKLKIQGWFQLSIVLTISSFANPSRCLDFRNMTRMQIQCYKNDELLFYLTFTVHEKEELPISTPVYPIFFNKTDNFFIRVTNPGCIYSQRETGVLTVTKIS